MKAKEKKAPVTVCKPKAARGSSPRNYVSPTARPYQGRTEDGEDRFAEGESRSAPKFE